MNPFQNRNFIFCAVLFTSSSIIAQTSERSEEGIKVYSGGILALSASQKEGLRSTSVTSGVELSAEFFKTELDQIAPEAFSLFGNLTQILARQPPQSRIGLRSSKELKWRRGSFSLNLEGNSRQWREGEDGFLFVDSYEGGPIRRHQFTYKAQLGSRFLLTERSELHFDVNAERQLHYAQGDRIQLLGGIKHDVSRVWSHEMSMSRSYFLGESPTLGKQQETIETLEITTALKLEEALQLRCKAGFGEIHGSSGTGKAYYSGGCLAELRRSLYKESFELSRSVDKDFLSGDFIERDKFEMGLTRNLGLKDRASFYLAYFLDRDVGGAFWGNKKRLDASLNLMTQLDGLQTETYLKNPYVLTSATWSLENSGSTRQGQVYQMGLGGQF